MSVWVLYIFLPSSQGYYTDSSLNCFFEVVPHQRRKRAHTRPTQQQLINRTINFIFCLCVIANIWKRIQRPGAANSTRLFTQFLCVERNLLNKLKEKEIVYLDVESLMMTALAATVGDVILRQLHADQILHDHLGVVVVVVMMMMVIIIVIDVVVVVVVVVVIVLVDKPAVSN